MTSVLHVLAAIAIMLAAHGVWSARRNLRHTTLVSAWRWSAATLAMWSAVWILSTRESVPARLTDLLWYLAALISLCPPVAVLGARRPGVGAWTAFVLLPLLAVLGWPLLTIWTDDFQPRELRLETPLLLGFVLVLLMGAGNYVGTRFSLSAGLYFVAVCLVVAPVSALAPAELQGSAAARQIATLCLGLAVYSARLASRKAADERTGLDRLWFDFRDTFGLVWAKRFQERVNVIAGQQQWPARLEDDGLHWNQELTSARRQAAVAKIDQTFRWLLRRFVDEAWIEERLAGTIESPS